MATSIIRVVSRNIRAFLYTNHLLSEAEMQMVSPESKSMHNAIALGENWMKSRKRFMAIFLQAPFCKVWWGGWREALCEESSFRLAGIWVSAVQLLGSRLRARRPPAPSGGACHPAVTSAFRTGATFCMFFQCPVVVFSLLDAFII